MRTVLAMLLTLASLAAEPVSEYFEDVLLVINFNHPFYGNIEFFEEIYRPHFKHIVYYGEAAHPDVNVIQHHQGWFLHRVVEDVMTKWPEYKGYIFCQDDCFMNFSNFLRLDKDKIWFHAFWSTPLKSANITWPWWNYPMGYQAVKQAVRKLPKSFRSTLFKNCRFFHVPIAWADFFYIPGRLKDKAIQICPCFDSPNVFLEMGIPTLLLSLDDFENMELLNAKWGGTIQSVGWDEFDGDYDWIHPIKFSDPKNRDFIRSLDLFEI